MLSLWQALIRQSLKERASSEKNVDKKVFYNYLKRQCDNYALDFEDLINFTLYIFKQGMKMCGFAGRKSASMYCATSIRMLI